MTKFQKELEALINKHSIENVSDTPDFILAQFMVQSLLAFEHASNERIKELERELEIAESHLHDEHFEHYCQEVGR